MTSVLDPVEELLTVRRSVENHVLREIEAKHLGRRTPAIDVFCSDFRRNWEATAHLARLRGFIDGEDWLLHGHRWHGGALRIVPNSPTNRMLPGGAHLVFLEDILEAPEITGIRELFLRAHFPCGKARKACMGFADVLGDLVRAKRYLRNREFPARIITMLHVDYTALGAPERGMRSYYACPATWEKVTAS